MNILIMISQLLNSLLVGVLFIDMLERRFPEGFKKSAISFSYNIIYFYSNSQILFMKYNKKFNEFIENSPTLLKIKKDFELLMKPRNLTTYEFIKDGKPISLFSKESSDYDFTVVSWFNEDTNYIHKKIVYDKEEQTLTLPETSDIKFILLEFKVGENKLHKIDLKTDNINFNIVGNSFTRQFFIYYLKQVLKINEEFNENDKFSLKIVDYDVNSTVIDFTDKNESILLEKTSYKINIINHSKSE
jgi:hypothetical protein